MLICSSPPFLLAQPALPRLSSPAWHHSLICLPLPGGFFDGKTSAEERQRYLLDTIRTSTQRTAAPGSVPLSDAQVNQLLARGDDELALFQAEDRRMRVSGPGLKPLWGRLWGTGQPQASANSIPAV
jgi:hypothetical protein